MSVPDVVSVAMSGIAAALVLLHREHCHTK